MGYTVPCAWEIILHNTLPPDAPHGPYPAGPRPPAGEDFLRREKADSHPPCRWLRGTGTKDDRGPTAGHVAGPSDPFSHTLTLDDERFAKLVSTERLRATWRIIRREARRHRIRDVVDYLDWSRSIDECLPDLSRSLLEGSYAPQPPARYDLAKAKGSFRVVTLLRYVTLSYTGYCATRLSKSPCRRRCQGPTFLAATHPPRSARHSTSKTTHICNSSMCGCGTSSTEPRRY